MTVPIGTRLGPYEIINALGAGGMGEVYRARDTKLNRDVALKILPEALATDPDRLARFRREAQVLASLNHPNIGHIYGFEDSGATHALVLELIDGPTLAEMIAGGAIDGAPGLPPSLKLRRTRRSLGGGGQARGTIPGAKAPGLHLNEALPIARQIADALEAAHEQGIIHRDLKPANIKVREDGTVKVLDFGLAKALDPMEPRGFSPGEPDADAPTMTSPALMTRRGAILGTAAYMSPEQARGKPVDRRADVWAFGAVLYEMLAGRRAFEGNDVSITLANVLKEDVKWEALPADLPSSVRRLLRRCLEKDPKRRLSAIGDARLEMDDAGSASSEDRIAGPSPAAAAAVPRWQRILPWTLAALLAVALAAVWALAQWTSAPTLQPMRFSIVPTATRLLANNGFDRMLAVSPAGTHIVYVSGTGIGGGRLIVRAIDRLEVEPLRGLTGARSPFFSPNGQHVGFFQGITELKTVSVTGGPPITLCKIAAGPRGASWGPDDTIVFATGDTTTGLLSVPAAGGDPKMLTTPDTALGEVDHLFPSVLPGGRAVLFTITAPGGQSDHAQVAVLDLKTGQRKTLIRGGSQAEYVAPFDGTQGGPGYLVYAAAGTLRSVRFDLGRLEIQGSPVPIVEQVAMVNTGAAQYAVSHTGALVYVPASGAFVPGGGIRSLVWANRQGREEAIEAPPRRYLALRLSPDGTRLALDIRDQENDIWTWDLARLTLTRLTSDPGVDVFPVWTPDGRRIVFGTSRNGRSNLFWQPADGTGAVERLTTSNYSQIANSFSPDGTRLLLTEARPSDHVSVLSIAGKGQATPLVHGTFNARNAEVSPDGRWMAYQSDESGQRQVYVRPFPDVNSARWQVSTVGGSQPAWAPNGRELFYIDGNSFLTTVPVQTAGGFNPGAPTKLFELRITAATETVRSYDVSRDGQRFVFIKDAPADPTAAPASMVVVLNWVEELKAKVGR